MRSFYRDQKSSAGWNNTLFGTWPCRVLHDVQGLQRAVYHTEKHESETVKDVEGQKVTEEQVFDRFEIEKPDMTTQQYDEHARPDQHGLFGEPAKLVRYRLGVFVLVFLAIFLVVAYLLKKNTGTCIDKHNR